MSTPTGVGGGALNSQYPSAKLLNLLYKTIFLCFNFHVLFSAQHCQGLYDKNRLSNTSAALLLSSLRVTVHMPTTAVRKAHFEAI